MIKIFVQPVSDNNINKKKCEFILNFNKMEIINKESNSQKNLGVQTLRFLLCFWVIVDHCMNRKTKYSLKIFFELRLHVPCFILISFYFSFNNIYQRKINKIKQRLKRLLIPYYIFPITILLMNNLSFKFFKSGIFDGILTLKDLFTQYIIGYKFIIVFWFQFYLILTSLFFSILSFLSKEKLIELLFIIYIIAYSLRYTNINYNYFSKFTKSIKYSVGQFAEVMPLSVSGSVIAFFNIFKILEKSRYKSIFYAIVVLCFIFKYDIFVHTKKFGFDGLVLEVGSIATFFLFYLLPLNNISSYLFNTILIILTNYTQGIYCLHLILFHTFKNKINSIKNGKFSGIILLYIFSYIISFIGAKLSKFTNYYTKIVIIHISPKLYIL